MTAKAGEGLSGHVRGPASGGGEPGTLRVGSTGLLRTPEKGAVCSDLAGEQQSHQGPGATGKGPTSL